MRHERDMAAHANEGVDVLRATVKIFAGLPYHVTSNRMVDLFIANDPRFGIWVYGTSQPDGFSPLAHAWTTVASPDKWEVALTHKIPKLVPRGRVAVELYNLIVVTLVMEG